MHFVDAILCRPGFLDRTEDVVPGSNEAVLQSGHQEDVEEMGERALSCGGECIEIGYRSFPVSRYVT